MYTMLLRHSNDRDDNDNGHSNSSLGGQMRIRPAQVMALVESLLVKEREKNKKESPTTEVPSQSALFRVSLYPRSPLYVWLTFDYT